jgi:hypothetical protein
VIEIRYTPGVEIEVRGRVAAVAAVRRAVDGLLELDKPSVGIEAARGYDPVPFEAALALLVVRRADGPLRHYVVARRALVLEGSPEELRRFASLLEDRGAGEVVRPSSASPDAALVALVIK